jgi:thiol-disulfide isomerase/thioredoxin
MTDWFDNTLVKTLTASDFENKIPSELKDKRCAFVLFFADWCGHCRDFKPEYIKFADLAQFFKAYAVDSVANENLLKKIKSQVPIQGFPTIWIYKKGKPLRVYTGPRTSQGLLTEARKVCSEKCNCDI